MTPQTNQRIQLAGVIAILVIAAVGGLVIWAMTHRARFPIAIDPPEPPLGPPPITRPTSRPHVSLTPYQRGPLEPHFGADRVWHLSISNVSGVRNLRRVVDKRVRMLIPTGDRGYIYGISRGTLTIHLAPIDDPDELKQKIDFGTITNVDPATRTISIAADREKFANP